MANDRDGALARQRARKLLVKALYQWQIAGHDLGELEKQFRALPEFERCDGEYFTQLLSLVIEDAAELDVVIARHAARGLEHLDAVGHGILLLAIGELKHRVDVPTKVVINEAVELAKRYGAADSFKFVNAMLDKIARELDRGVPAASSR